MNYHSVASRTVLSYAGLDSLYYLAEGSQGALK